MATSAPARVLPSLLPDGSGGGDDAGIYACLFDMDGTLCDTDPLHHEVFSNLLLAHGKNGGVPIDDDFFHKHIAGRTNEDIFADLWPELSVPEREAMWEKKEEDFRALAASKLERLPGLTELLAWIDARGIRKVAVTNAPRPNAELMLRALGLEEYFEHVVIGTECARAKPHPDPYLEGMRLVGAGDASRCVAFEDSPAGAAAAIAAGIPTVGVTDVPAGERAGGCRGEHVHEELRGGAADAGAGVSRKQGGWKWRVIIIFSTALDTVLCVCLRANCY